MDRDIAQALVSAIELLSQYVYGILDVLTSTEEPSEDENEPGG